MGLAAWPLSVISKFKERDFRRNSRRNNAAVVVESSPAAFVINYTIAAHKRTSCTKQQQQHLAGRYVGYYVYDFHPAFYFSLFSFCSRLFITNSGKLSFIYSDGIWAACNTFINPPPVDPAAVIARVRKI